MYLTTEEKARKNLSQGKQNFSQGTDCVFVALITQRAMPMRHIVICGLPGCTLFSISSHTSEYFREKTYLTRIVSSTIFVGNICYFNEIERGLMKNVLAFM